MAKKKRDLDEEHEEHSSTEENDADTSSDTPELVEGEIVDVDIAWLKDKADSALTVQKESGMPSTKEPPHMELVPADRPPPTVMAFPMPDAFLFPGMVAPVVLSSEALSVLVEKSKEQQQFVAFFAAKDETQDTPAPHQLYDVGVVGRVVRLVEMPNGMATVLVQVLERCRRERLIQQMPYVVVQISLLEDVIDPKEEATVEALVRNVRQLLSETAELIPQLPQEFLELLHQLNEPGHLADFVALQFVSNVSKKQLFLEELYVRSRLEEAFGVLLKESEMLKLQKDLREEIESKVEDRQREFLLREQLKLIRRELGEEADEKELDSEDFQQRIAAAGMPLEAEKKAKDELRRLSVLPPEAAEYNIIRTYLDWLCDLPWSKRSEGKIHIRKARAILNRDHFGLERVKERILEFLAVHKLKPDQKGAILCLSGPPGVGKTSLGRSIAQAMGREFYRFSVGGMRDEAEIKGHRRTYIGAMPGKLIQALKRVGTKNPVIMLDEIDKIGKDHRGDPASALLEVLDPAQNDGFQDHYLDLPFDLSEVMFIATANYRDAIPPPLLDRMEVIDLSGYIPEEKVEIARRYLLPRQREAHGLKAEQLRISKGAFASIVRGYTREAGVRQLEREIGAVCRKVATRVAESIEENEVRAMVRETNVERYLGPARFSSLRIHSHQPRPGRAFGLAWTPVGGDVLTIEVTQFPGKGQLQLTGKLGEVMSESSRIALSFLKANAVRFGLDLAALETRDLHLHFPAGAIPKDGPSAGITITTAFLSLLSGEKGTLLAPALAMTGEITLMGDVLPVGGIREKVVAATAAGVSTVILPEENRKDLSDVPDYIQKKLTFHFARHYEDVLPVAFGPDAFPIQSVASNA